MLPGQPFASGITYPHVAATRKDIHSQFHAEAYKLKQLTEGKRPMKKVLVSLLTLGLCGFAMAEDKSDVQKRLDNAATVLQEITAAPDKGIPEDVLNSAKGDAIVPHMVKTGFGIGGGHRLGGGPCQDN